jgi:hypothetical protein
MPPSKLRNNTPAYRDWLRKFGTNTVSPPAGGGGGGGVPLNLTTTLTAVTGHNISDSAVYNQGTFPTLFTGTSHKFSTVSGSPVISFAVDSTRMDDSQNAAAPLSVSKASLHTLMPPGWSGKTINYMQAWWGGLNHPNIGYSDTDAATFAAIMRDSASRGFDVVCVDWYGQTITNTGNDAIEDLVAANCAATGQTFCMMIDAQFFADNGFTAATYQSGLVAALNHLSTRYYSNASYEKSGGRPLVLLWNVANLVGANINWTTLKTQITGNPQLIHYQASGFSVTASDGAFAWVDSNAPFVSGVVDGTTYLTTSFLPACTSNQSLICISSALKGFNGTLTKNVAWSDGKFIDQQNGQTWLNWWSANASYVNAGHRLDYVGVITWDDFQEGTPVQCGILNDVGFTSAQIISTTLSWAVGGHENTVSSYDIYITQDGTNMAKLASRATSAAKSVDLSTFSIPPGTYSVYIQAVGQSCVVNRTTTAIPYTQH